MNDNHYKEKVAAHPLFADMKPEYIAILCECASEAVFKAGEIIFREREPATNLYLVQKGRISVEAHDPSGVETQIQELGPGEVLGWSWLFPPYVWHFQARALELSEVIALSGAHLLVTAERDRSFGYELMKRMAQVLIHRLMVSRKELLTHAAQDFTTD